MKRPRLRSLTTLPARPSLPAWVFAIPVDTALGSAAVVAFIGAAATSSIGHTAMADACTSVALLCTGFIGVRGLVADRRHPRDGGDRS